MRFEIGGVATAWGGAFMSADKFAMWMAGLASAVTIVVALVRLYWDWRKHRAEHYVDEDPTCPRHTRHDGFENWGGDE